MSIRASGFWGARAMTALVVCSLTASQAVHAGEFRFIVQDLPDNTAAWLPSEVVIHHQTDLSGGLIFILENPTARTHVFFAEGLYEQLGGEKRGAGIKPLRVTIGPEETVRAVVSTAQFQGAREERATEVRFFCPLHRADSDPGGMMRIVHRGGTIHIVQ